MNARFRARKTLRFGPIRINFTERGYSSWGIKIGPYSRNFTRGTWAFDTPGPGGLRGRSRR